LVDLRQIADAIGATYLPKARTAGVTAAIRARRAELQLQGVLSPESVAEVINAQVDTSFEAEGIVYESVEAMERELAGLEGADPVSSGAFDGVFEKQLESIQQRIAVREHVDAVDTDLIAVRDLGALAARLKCRITLTFEPDEI
jgi:hypothetical protein